MAVPPGFPYRLSNRELETAIEDMLEPTNWPGFHEFSGLSAELKVALVGSALEERGRRAAEHSSLRALRLSYAVLTVALASLLVSIVFALR